MTYVFALMAILAFIGFAIQARRRNGHGMVYAATVFVFWIAVLAWWTGAIG